MAALGRILLGFLVDKVWGLLMEGLKALWRMFQDWMEKRRQEKQNASIAAAEKRMADAEKIENDAERLKEKADAACDLERAINPDSDCGR